MKVRELSKKEIKEILEKIKNEYKIEKNLDFLEKEFLWFINREGKIFILKKEAKKFLNLDIVNKFGLYVLRLEKDGIRFSIEGSQIFGKFSKKIIELDKDKWMRGEEIKVDLNEKGYFIVKDGTDFMGGTKIKNNIARNYIPKDRRVNL